MTFDLENARAADEVLPYPLDAKEIWVSGKGQMHINPPNAPSIFFTLSDLCEFRNIFHGQAAEIERLQGFETAARDLNNDLIRIAGERDDLAAQIQELEDVHKRSGVKYAKIINELRSSVYANIPGLKKQWDEILNTPANGKIGPDADAKPREGLYGKYCISKADGSPVDPNADYFVLRLDTDPVARRAAREYSYVTPDRDLARGLQDRLAKYDPQLKDCMNIQFFGLEKPHCWQITEERIGLLEYCLETLLDAPDIEEIPGPGHSIEMLRAMLREAEQCE